MSQHGILNVIQFKVFVVFIETHCLLHYLLLFYSHFIFFHLRCSSLTTTIYQVNNCVVISVCLFASWTVRLYVHLILRVFGKLRLGIGCDNLVGCIYSTGFVYSLHNFIIIQCRVQLMITDQTVAINMKVRKRFFTLSFSSLALSYFCLFVYIDLLMILFSSFAGFDREIRINETLSTKMKNRMWRKNHDHRKKKHSRYWR